MIIDLLLTFLFRFTLSIYRQICLPPLHVFNLFSCLCEAICDVTFAKWKYYHPLRHRSLEEVASRTNMTTWPLEGTWFKEGTNLHKLFNVSLTWPFQLMHTAVVVVVFSSSKHKPLTALMKGRTIYSICTMKDNTAGSRCTSSEVVNCLMLDAKTIEITFSFNVHLLSTVKVGELC